MNKKQIEDWLKTAQPKQDLWDAGTRSSVKDLHLRKLSKAAAWRYRWIDITGKRRFEKLGNYPNLTLEAAREAAKQFAAKISIGFNPIEEKARIREAATNTAQNYLDEVYRQTLKGKKSGHETEQYFSRHFADLMDKPMSELSAKDITKWQNYMIERGLSFSTMKRSYGAFKTSLNHAVSKGYLDSNPLDNVKLDSIQETTEQAIERKKRRTYLTVEQMKALIGALDTYQEITRAQRRNSRLHGKPYLPDLDQVEFVDHVKPVVLFAFYTGFRPGDIYSLYWEHVNLNKFAPNIHKVIEKTAHKKPEPRTFPLNAELVEALKKWRKQQGNPTSGPVFPNPQTGKPFAKQAMKKKWEQIRKLAGLPEELQFYSLRHNFISQLVMKGHDLMSIAALAGHSDIQMIIDHYGHLQPNNLKSIISESFADLVRPNKKTGTTTEISENR